MNDTIRFENNVPLSCHTTFRIGGPADHFVTVRTVEAMQEAINFAHSSGIPFFLLGGGSNVLVNDRGIRGLVIKNQLKGLYRDEDSIRAFSGETLSDLLSFSLSQGLSGLEFTAGIPGTVGGAIFGNAGAYGRAVGDLLVRARVIDRESGHIMEVDQSFFTFAYRYSSLKACRHILTEAVLMLKPGDMNAMACEVEKILAERRSKHPDCDMACAGSYFKNLQPPAPGERRIPAGLILDRAGARGMSYGNAQVYDGHANFITNPGGATCEEILHLAGLLKEKVKSRFDVELEEEVIFVDEIPGGFHQEEFLTENSTTESGAEE